MNATDAIIYPPGDKLEVELTVTHCGCIELPSTYSQPLPTLVEAKRTYPDEIEITAIVLINTEFNDNYLPDLIVNQLFTISNYGTPQLQFFIHCSEEGLSKIKETQDGKYNAFKVIFTTQELSGFPTGIVMKDIETVETFLWNIDPKTSRGTVTTVQSTVPN
jgi:hypothetical protein